MNSLMPSLDGWPAFGQDALFRREHPKSSLRSIRRITQWVAGAILAIFSIPALALSCPVGQVAQYVVTQSAGAGPALNDQLPTAQAFIDAEFAAHNGLCATQYGEPVYWDSVVYNNDGTSVQTRHDCYKYYSSAVVSGAAQLQCVSERFFVALAAPSSIKLADSGDSSPSCGCSVNPSSGGEYHSDIDLPAIAGSQLLAFRRFYNSLVTTSADMGAGWRHTYSRSKLADPPTPTYIPSSLNNSSLYNDAATACSSGWSQIKAQAGQPNTTASYSNNVCTVSLNGTPIESVPVYSNGGNIAAPVATASFVRDDGHILHFTSTDLGHTYAAEQGITERLYVISGGGFQLVDAKDTVETYDGSGHLLSITDRAGTSQTLSYTNGLLTSVTDNFGHILSLAYDAQNRLQTVTAPDGTAVIYSYDSSSHLQTIQHPNNTTQQLQYEDPNWPNGLSSLTDDNGATYLTWAYDAQGRVTSEHLAGGAGASSYVYNADGSTTATDALGAQRTFGYTQIGGHMKNGSITGAPCVSCGYDAATTYDSAGFLSSKTDYKGNVTTYTYDAARGLELSRTEASGTPQARTITTAYLANYRLPTQIDEPGRRTTISYDGSGNLLTKTIKDTATNTTRTSTYTYNSVGQVLTEDGPRTDVNDVTTFAYNNCATGGGCGQLHTVTDALNHVTTINTYDANGRPLTITDPNGTQTTLTYNTRGWLTSRQTSTETTTYQYDGVGQLTKITLPVGAFLSYTYDGAHRLTQITDQLGNKIVYTLDAMDNRTQENVYDPTNALAQTRRHVYDSLSRLAQDIGAQNQTTTYSYDNNDNLTQVTDPLNHVTQNSYDALNRLVQVTDPGNRVAKYSYNALDQLTQVTDPRSLATVYTPNALGDNGKTSSPDSGDTVATFDAAGNVLTRKDAKGQTTTYQYDALNRLTKTTRNDGTVITFTYDQGSNGIGRLTTMADASGNTAWVYDALGRVTKKTQTNGSTSLVTQYSYDSAGRLITQTYPSGKVLTFTWTNGQITALSLNNNPIVSNLIYQPFGAPKSWSFGNGQLITRSFDQDGRLTTYDLGTLGYDAASRITSLTLGGSSVLTGSKTWGYDNLDRLTSYVSGAGSIGYVYDANGNVTSATATGTTPTTYSISPTSNKITSISSGSTNFTPAYDANGSLTQDPRNTYSYDSANQLIAPAGYTYSYNGLRQRVQKTASAVTSTLNNPTLAPVTGLLGSVLPTVQQTTATVGTPTVTNYVYDEAAHLIGEYNGTTPIQETIWLGDQPLATVNPSGTFYIHSDQLGTPRQIDNAQQQAVWAWDSVTYGATAPNEDPRNTGTKFSYSQRFTNQTSDPETGLSDNRVRTYNPYIPTYNQVDPLGLAGGRFNPLGYANQNPISFNDPTGLSTAVVDRAAETITVTYNDGTSATYPVGNNTTNPAGDPKVVGSNGPAPAGTVPVQAPINTGKSVSYGPVFFPLGSVNPDGTPADITRKRGIGLHGGRRSHKSRTEGCLRMDNEDIIDLLDSVADDPLTTITIK